jgi:hypothetical protein
MVLLYLVGYYVNPIFFGKPDAFAACCATPPATASWRSA